jgi:hypothetical protein
MLDGVAYLYFSCDLELLTGAGCLRAQFGYCSKYEEIRACKGSRYKREEMTNATELTC